MKRAARARKDDGGGGQNAVAVLLRDGMPVAQKDTAWPIQACFGGVCFDEPGHPRGPKIPIGEKCPLSSGPASHREDNLWTGPVSMAYYPYQRQLRPE
jgi:hypothetical protein